LLEQSSGGSSPPFRTNFDLRDFVPQTPFVSLSRSTEPR